MKFACVFPGQGAQSLGMLSELSHTHATVKQTFEEASDILDLDLWSIVVNGPEEALNSTQNTQPIMLAAGVCVWRIWQAADGCLPSVMAGHSFGEYSALVCAGALEFAKAVNLVRERGRLMQAAVPHGEGAMAAILGLEDQQVIELCHDAAKNEVVAAANFNSPGQIVIAGHTNAVERAMALASKAGAKRVMRLAVSVPVHCDLMQSAAAQFTEKLREVPFHIPKISVIHNVDVQRHDEPEMILEALSRQLYSPVRWAETIKSMVDEGVNAIFEIGPGKVLTGLNRRIDRSLRGVCVQDNASLHRALKMCGEVE